MENHLISTEPAVICSLLDGMLYSVLEKKLPPLSNTSVGNENIQFNHLGENNKYILFLLNYQNTTKVLPDEDLELITKTLIALKLELRDVVLLNHQEYPSKTLKDIVEYFSPNKIVLFDHNPALLQIGQEITQNSISQFQNKSLLVTSSLSELQTNKDLKLVWWSAMKALLST